MNERHEVLPHLANVPATYHQKPKMLGPLTAICAGAIAIGVLGLYSDNYFSRLTTIKSTG